MSHRRSSSLTGSAKVSDYQVPTTAQARARPRPPQKASSLDVGDHGVAGGASHNDGEGSQRGRPDNLAQAAFSAAQSAYEALENRSEAIFQRFDDSIDELENGPLAQTARATVHRAAVVIEKPVGRIKQSRFVEEVSGVITEIENTEMVQAARGRARQAYMYVEPISEKILSRVGSLDADEEGEVQFVIPPSMQRAPGRSIEAPSKPRPVLRPYEPEGKRIVIDPSQYVAIQEEVPQIHVSGEDGRCSVLSQGSDNLLKVKAPDQISIVSATDSERQYEIVRPYKLYRTPPLPPPRHKEHRRSLQVKLSNSGVRTSIVEENSEKRKLLEDKPDSCYCSTGTSAARSVRFSDDHPTSGEGGKTENSSSVPNPDRAHPASLGVRRVVDVCERRPALKDTSKTQDSIDKRNSLLDECREAEPLVPIETLEGSSIAKIREKMREYNYNVVCINGKTFYVPKPVVKEPETREVYGGASTFFESSETIDWKTVKDASGHEPPIKEKPRWMQRLSTGLENFLSNAHDPWLSEADRDPLACDSCCSCFDTTFGWNKKRGPKFPLHQKNEFQLLADEPDDILSGFDKTFCVVSKVSQELRPQILRLEISLLILALASSTKGGHFPVYQPVLRLPSHGNHPPQLCLPRHDRNRTRGRVYVLSHLLGGDDDQDGSQRVYPQQVHLPKEPLELAGLRGHRFRLRHPRHRTGRWMYSWGTWGSEDVSCVEGAEDGSPSCLEYPSQGRPQPSRPSAQGRLSSGSSSAQGHPLSPGHPQPRVIPSPGSSSAQGHPQLRVVLSSESSSAPAILSSGSFSAQGVLSPGSSSAQSHPQPRVIPSSGPFSAQGRPQLRVPQLESSSAQGPS
ncbi:uncharacterized protein LOC121873582 [Homarus americanus]|uniref:uncharacterized protein LOC121873582 n=1 Tax=Homarus americanus TaxID=6706 RepID=UPI001C48539F|nr:uncharacterized protein LOC121873582 [Homarus americanus]